MRKCENRVLVLDRRSVNRRGGMQRSSSTAGPIERMLCSNNSVKSNPERQSLTIGPKASSFEGWHSDAMMLV